MSTPDFFRARLDQMIDLRHPLAVLATRMPWQQIEASVAPLLARKDRRGRSIEGADLFGPTLQVVGAGVSAAGRPRLAIRLMVSLLYLKHAYGLSDQAVVERWAENVVWQFFSGQEYYEPRLPCDATQIGRFRRVLGEAGVPAAMRTPSSSSGCAGCSSASAPCSGACCATCNAACWQRRKTCVIACSHGWSAPSASARSAPRTSTSCTRCMRRRSSASARARPASPTSSA